MKHRRTVLSALTGALLMTRAATALPAALTIDDTVAMLAVALAASGCNASATPAEAPEHGRDFIRLDPRSPRLDFIKVEVAKESDDPPHVQLSGRVTFDEDHTQRVASAIDGRVTKILVQLGEKVHPRQPLVELSSPAAADLQAQAQKADQDRNLSEQSAARVDSLRLEGAVSEKAVAQVEADLKKAQAEVARAQAQLRSLGLMKSGPSAIALLRSQIGGTVVERSVLIGQEVRGDGAAPLLTITDLGTVWVLADVYEQDLTLLKEGAPIELRVPAYPGEIFAGKVDHVGDVLDPSTRTMKVRCLVPNPGRRLKPEMFAKVDLAGDGSQGSMLLPAKAILTDSEHAKVIVASEDNVYRQRVVEVGPETDGKVRVTSGILPGERIVTDGAIFLKREMESD